MLGDLMAMIGRLWVRDPFSLPALFAYSDSAKNYFAKSSKEQQSPTRLNPVGLWAYNKCRKL